MRVHCTKKNEKKRERERKKERKREKRKNKPRREKRKKKKDTSKFRILLSLVLVVVDCIPLVPQLRTFHEWGL